MEEYENASNNPDVDPCLINPSKVNIQSYDKTLNDRFTQLSKRTTMKTDVSHKSSSYIPKLKNHYEEGLQLMFKHSHLYEKRNFKQGHGT